MPQRKRKTPVPSGMSAKQMKRRKPIGIDHLKTIEPLTTNQEKVFKSYAKGKHLVLHGAAGTGKTFLAGTVIVSKSKGATHSIVTACFVLVFTLSIV